MLHEPFLFTIIGIIVFFSALVQGISGFGMALVSMSVLPFILPLRIVTPLVLLNGFLVTLVLFVSKREHCNMRDLIPLLISAAVGIPFGIYLLAYANEAILRKILAAIIIIFCIYSFIKINAPKKFSTHWSYFFGFLAGSLGAAFNINGPPVIIHAALQQWDKNRMMANLQAFFLISAILIAIGHHAKGLYTRDVLFMWIAFTPLNVAGTYIGNRINARINAEMFKKIVLTLLIISGLILGIA